MYSFSMNGVNIALDVNSGAVHVVDELAFRLINELPVEGYEAAEIAVAQAEIEELRGKGQLFSASREKAERQAMAGRKAVVKSLCLHIAHACNLRCRYCFAGEGDYGGGGLMSAEVGRKAVDFLIENSEGRRNLEIDFFGGEPTLNFDVVKEIVAYAKFREKAAGKIFRFTLTTNGLLLDTEKIEYINAEMDNVVLSLDGRKEVNDRMRPCVGGASAYDMVVPRFLELVEARGDKSYYVRGTYTHENLDFSQDVLHMAELGFRNISVEPVVAAAGSPYAIRAEDVPILCAEYEKLAIYLKANPRFQFFHFMIDLQNGPCVAKRITGCGAGTEYLAVTPEGDLYPCHQFVGVDSGKFYLGSLETGVTADTAAFSMCNVYSKPECRGCFARYFCSGGCMASSYSLGGDIRLPDEVFCQLQRKRLECGLYLLS
ncbi:MAG: thioether cross-link-forming SCIFF peptide maturase [Turicibacter sp.]|nr:thioether cross-link-forming SCIFF peptide maturase [Turicibacter sp.]